MVVTHLVVLGKGRKERRSHSSILIRPRTSTKGNRFPSTRLASPIVLPQVPLFGPPKKPFSCCPNPEEKVKGSYCTWLTTTILLLPLLLLFFFLTFETCLQPQKALFRVSFIALPTHAYSRTITCAAETFPNHYLQPLLRGWVDYSHTHTHIGTHTQRHRMLQAWVQGRKGKRIRAESCACEGGGGENREGSVMKHPSGCALGNTVHVHMILCAC